LTCQSRYSKQSIKSADYSSGTETRMQMEELAKWLGIRFANLNIWAASG
jgi:hypothetical protein